MNSERSSGTREIFCVDACETVEKSPDVMPAANFPVGHDREAGLLLVENGKPNGIILRVDEFGSVEAPGRPEHIGGRQP